MDRLGRAYQAFGWRRRHKPSHRLVRRMAMKYALLLILGASLLGLVVACDPTEDALGIRIVNDVGEVIELQKCDDSPTCSGTIRDVSLKPGNEFPTNVSGGGGVQWFRALRGDGSTYGCLRVQLTKRVEGLKFNASSFTPCPSHFG